MKGFKTPPFPPKPLPGHDWLHGSRASSLMVSPSLAENPSQLTVMPEFGFVAFHINRSPSLFDGFFFLGMRCVTAALLTCSITL